METRTETAPKVVPVGFRGRVGITPATPGTPWPASTRLAYRLVSKVNREDECEGTVRADPAGTLELDLSLATVGEYRLELRATGDAEPRAVEWLYAVDPRWKGLKPFKVDLHLHTTHSDGRAGPVAMLVAGCRAGMDAMAVTDHDVQAPLDEVRAFCTQTGLDMGLIAGEEVTIRGVGGHILSLGASGAVGPTRSGAACEAAIPVIAAEFAGHALLPPLRPETYAHAVWTARCIRERGGLAVMAHPYWQGTTGRFYPPPYVVEQLLRDDLLDGLEAFGGSPANEGNMLAIARFAEEARSGRHLTVTGGSDAHDAADAGRLWTLVLAGEATPDALLRALADRRSLACDDRMSTDTVAFGEPSLLMYGYFLIREFFPWHDRIRHAQGDLAALAAGGGAAPDVADRMRTLNARMADLYRRFGLRQAGGQAVDSGARVAL